MKNSRRPDQNMTAPIKSFDTTRGFACLRWRTDRPRRTKRRGVPLFFNLALLPVGWALAVLIVWAGCFATTCVADERSDLLTKATSAAKNKEYDLAIKYFDQLISLGVPDALYGRGSIYLDKQEYDKALLDYSKLIEIRPSAFLFMSRGDIYSKIGEAEKAVVDYTEAIKINPSHGDVYVLRASQYIKLNSFDAALTDCNMAILMLSRDAKEQIWLEAAYMLRSSVFSRQGKYDRIYDDCSKVIEIEPTKSEAFNARGWAAVGLKEYDKAISDCETALRLNPKDAVACWHLGWIMATCPDSKYRDGQKALEYAQKAYEMTASTDWHNLTTLAAAYAECGNFEQAVNWEQKAVALGLESEDLKSSQGRLELYKSLF